MGSHFQVPLNFEGLKGRYTLKINPHFLWHLMSNIKNVNKFQLHKNILSSVTFPPCLIKLNWWIFFPKHMSIILPCDYYCCNCNSNEWSWILGCLFLDKVFSVRLQFYFLWKFIMQLWEEMFQLDWDPCTSTFFYDLWLEHPITICIKKCK